MKKILTLTLVLLGIFSLAACGNGEDQEYVEEARDRLVLAFQRDNVTSDVTLPTELGNYPDVEITWESDDSDIVDDDGTVTRPEPGEGNASVTLTATLTYEDAEATRDFDLTVIEKVEENLQDDFSELYEDGSTGETITLQGVVTSIFSGGAFLWDGDTHMAIYDSPDFEIHDEVELGDEIKYTGEYAKYNTLYQVSERESLEVVSSDNDHDVSPTEISIEDLYDDYDPDDADKDVHGQHFTVQGKITQKGDDDNIYIESLTTDDQLEVYYYSLSDSLSALEDRVGDVVELEVVYYTLYSSGDIRVVYQEGEDGISDVELDLKGQMDSDISDIEDTRTQGEDVTLPETGENGTEFSNWESSDTDIIDDDGTFVSYPDEVTTVTFTGDASLGDESDTASFEVSVLPEDPDTVDDTRSADEEDTVFVEGVVTSFPVFSGSPGFYIQDSDGTGIMIESDLPVSIGDKVQVTGEMSHKTEHQEENTIYRITDASLLDNDEGDHDVFVFDDVSAQDIATQFADNQSQRYRLENVTVDEVSEEYNSVYIETGEDFRIRYDIRNYGPSIGDTHFEEGDTIEWIEFTIDELSFGDIMVEYVTGKDFEELDTEITTD
ncbi:MAG: immunoglobulin-like domain-containing protein [Candidatus Izemoplasmataceae bacterium]